MSSYLYVAAAAALLTTPPDALELPEASKLYDVVAPPLRSLALHWELLDARETYFLAEDTDSKTRESARAAFHGHLKLLQGRFQELANAPPLDDCNRFPDRHLIGDLLAFNRSYRNSLAMILEVDLGNVQSNRTALEETDQLYRVYDALRDARCDYYLTHARRHALKTLRELVGDEAYYSGQLPPHIPLWRIPIAN